jgi:arginase
VRRAGDIAADAVRVGAAPLVLGGDHSLGAGSVAGVASALAERGESLGPHLARRPRRPAHPGLERERQRPRHARRPPARLGDARLSQIARPCAAVRVENVAFVGLRDLDPPEQEFIRHPACARSPCATSTSGGCGR